MRAVITVLYPYIDYIDTKGWSHRLPPFSDDHGAVGRGREREVHVERSHEKEERRAGLHVHNISIWWPAAPTAEQNTERAIRSTRQDDRS